MYKILLLVLHGKGLTLENRKTLLSEIAEVLPCMLRQEADLVQGMTKLKLFEADEKRTPQLESYLLTYTSRSLFAEFRDKSTRPLLLRIID